MHRMKSITAALMVGSLLVLAAGSGRPPEDDLQNRLAVRLEEVRAAGGYPGITAAISTPDGRVVVAAAGWADAEDKVPMKPTDRMLAGSTGKTFVSAVILQAVDEGQLD